MPYIPVMFKDLEVGAIFRNSPRNFSLESEKTGETSYKPHGHTPDMVYHAKPDMFVYIKE
jgi:hypothetical protein